MKKLKLLTAVLFCLGVAGMASAGEVISIDFNKQGDANAYSGTNAGYTEGTLLWRVYDGYPEEALGKAMGSSRTADLRNSDEPCMPGTYAAQVWISDDANNHDTYDACSAVVGLMDDGFEKTGGGADPCITLWGKGAYRCDPNYMSYDIYVYGADEGNFTITSPGRNETKHVSGGIGGGFVPGGNYVVFEDVNFYDVNMVNFDTDSNKVILSYTNKLNGLQLVKKLRSVVKEAVTIYDPDPSQDLPWTGMEVNAPEYDVAYETNARNSEPTYFGPDLGIITTVPPVANVPCVTYLDAGEYMEYDIYVADGNDGNYQIDAYVNIANGECDNLYVSIDNVELGRLRFVRGDTGTPADNQFYWTYETPGFAGEGFIHQSVTGFLFKGPHTFKWRIGGLQGVNLAKFKFNYLGPISMDCNDVYKYGFGYSANDLNKDCHVDFKDLKLITDSWLQCDDPEDPNCTL